VAVRVRDRGVPQSTTATVTQLTLAKIKQEDERK